MAKSTVAPTHRKKKKFKWLKRFALVLSVLLIAAGASGYYLMNRFEGNIKTEEFIEPEKPRPEVLPEVEGALNILVMGSDDREGTDIGGETPGLSDTTIFLHIDEDRKFAYGVSIPRDTMVDRPACPLKNGEGTDPGGFAQFNSAFAVGGPSCTVATVEAATGVRVNNFMVLDFNGFEDVIDAVGGVEMCVPEEVDDPIGKIKLRAGTYNMDGKTALDYVRVRHGLGQDLGDIGRMKRQQAFISSLVEKVSSAGTLSNPVKILDLLEATTSSLTTDPEFANIRKLAGLANSLRNIGMENIQFVTVPFEAYAPNPNRVVWTDKAEELWALMREDQPIPEDFDEEVITADRDVASSPSPATPTPAPTSAAPPSSPAPSSPDISDANRKAYGLC